MRKLVVLLLVLVLLALGADRAADWFAEETVATRLESSQRLDQRPEVDIAGFPFLTQLWAGRFDRVTATLDDVSLGRGQDRVRLSSLQFRFGDVRTDRRLERVEAATGRATARISYAELGRVTGLDLAYAGEGRVRASRELTVAGERFAPAFTIEPQVLDGAVDLAVDAFGRGLPPAVQRVLREELDLELPLDGLPFDVRVRSVRAAEDGLRLQLVAREVTLRG